MNDAPKHPVSPDPAQRTSQRTTRLIDPRDIFAMRFGTYGHRA